MGLHVGRDISRCRGRQNSLRCAAWEEKLGAEVVQSTGSLLAWLRLAWPLVLHFFSLRHQSFLASDSVKEEFIASWRDTDIKSGQKLECMPRNKPVKGWRNMVQSGKKSPFPQICEADKNKVTEGAGNMSVKTQKMGLNEKMLHMSKVVDSLGEVLTLFFLPCSVSEMSALPLLWGDIAKDTKSRKWNFVDDVFF